MKKISLALLPILLLITALCLADDKPSVTPSGFLSDYSRLVPDPDAKDNYFHYTAPEDSGRKLGKIYFVPISTFPADASFKLVDRATVAQAISSLDAILRKKLSNKATLVASPDEADSVVQIVVTNVSSQDAGRSAIDFIPLRLLTKPIKDAAMGKVQEVVATLEMRIEDAKTHHVLFEAVHRSEGKNIGRADDADLKASNKDLSPIIDVWTNKIVKEITTPK